MRFGIYVSEADAAAALRAIAPVVDAEAEGLDVIEKDFDPASGYGSCPACGTRLASGSVACPECGLAVGRSDHGLPEVRRQPGSRWRVPTLRLRPVIELLPCVEMEAEGAARGAVIWLHGLGASGHDFEDVVPLLQRPDVRFVFPHAPRRPVTINAGMIMPAWYDILSLEGPRLEEDERGIRSSAALVQTLIERERERGLEAAQIVLAGFSQGGAMALFVADRYKRDSRGPHGAERLRAARRYPWGRATGSEHTNAAAALPRSP